MPSDEGDGGPMCTKLEPKTAELLSGLSYMSLVILSFFAAKCEPGSSTIFFCHCKKAASLRVWLCVFNFVLMVWLCVFNFGLMAIDTP